jgi:hypothetical protein
MAWHHTGKYGIATVRVPQARIKSLSFRVLPPRLVPYLATNTKERLELLLSIAAGKQLMFFNSPDLVMFEAKQVAAEFYKALDKALIRERLQ